MPKVGKKHYPYTKAGYKAAEKAREKLQVGGPVVNARGRSTTYQEGKEIKDQGQVWYQVSKFKHADREDAPKYKGKPTTFSSHTSKYDKEKDEFVKDEPRISKIVKSIAKQKKKEQNQVGGPVSNAMERSVTYQAGGETWASRLKKSLKPISVDEYNKQSDKRKVDQKVKQKARVAKRKEVVGKVKKSLKPQTVKEYKAGEGERRAKSKAKQKKRKATYSKVAGVIKKGLTPKPIEKKKTKKKKGAVKRSKYSGHIS